MRVMGELSEGLVSDVEQAGDYVRQIQLFAIHKHKAFLPDGAAAL